MTAPELTTCFMVPTSPLNPLASGLKGHESEIIKAMDRMASLTFADYLFIRKTAAAITTCGDAGYFLPAKLYCGLSITSPRAPVLTAPEEK